MSNQAEPPTPEPSLANVIGRIAHDLAKVLPAGDVAALRRQRPGDPGGMAFWKIAGTHLVDQLPEGGALADERERRWAVLLQAFAQLQGLHAPGLRLGRVLAERDLAEMRFLRLLRAHGDALADMIRLTAHFLANKAAAVNFVDLASLVLTDGGAREEEVRRRVARDYYRNADRKEKHR